MAGLVSPAGGTWVFHHFSPTKITQVLHLKTMESMESIRHPNQKDELFLSPKLGITIVENDDVPELDGIWLVFPTLFSDLSPEGSVSRPMLWVPWQRPRFHGKKLTQKRQKDVGDSASWSLLDLGTSIYQPPPTISTVLSRSTVI